MSWLFNPVHAATRLAGHASPYLAMHADDPVDWREWGPAAMAEAKRQNRLLLVSVGYFACHWCHVMQRESYRDAEVARLLNAHYIPVKVDRELNAALDAALQAFSERTRGRSGWPLNVFITPEGYPLFAMQYAPRDEFLRIGTALAERWRADAAQLKAVAQAAAIVAPQPRLPADLRAAFISRSLEEADLLRGGFGTAAKFPLAPQLAVLLDFQARQPNAELADFLSLTLDQMAGRGLFDHVAGGFFRYTVDPDWQQPHFEKMLYDNAQLASLYLQAARVLRQPRYRAVAERTLDFVLARMALADAFVASLSAIDADGVEGGAYLWPADRIKALLSEAEWPVVQRLWALDRVPEFEAGHLPFAQGPVTAAEDRLQRSAWTKLAQGRINRVIPRDEKIVAGWNGLLLAALAESGRELPRHAEAAAKLYHVIQGRLWDGRRLHKGLSANGALAGAELEDYAYVARGAWHYAQASGDQAARQFSLQVQRQAWQRFYKADGFRLEERELVIAKTDAWEEGHTPAPAPLLVELGLMSGEADLQRRARNALTQALKSARGDVFWRAGLVRLAAIIPAPSGAAAPVLPEAATLAPPGASGGVSRPAR
ncbi:MAG: thioredoxin domain-containing protein [Hydrogenophilaceae bacterium]|nr:thioredoxin domain-containing protein [Hydrogenophilaceae bacterium]